MSEVLRRKLEQVFDPTDADGAMSLAYTALTLMRRAYGAVETDNSGLRLGRDQKGDIASAVIEHATRLGLLSSWASAQEIQSFIEELMQRAPQPSAPKEKP